MSAKRIHYDAAFKRKLIVYADEHGNRAAGRKFDISEANIRRWRNDRNAIFSCEATTKCFRGRKKGRYTQVDEAVLPVVIEGRAKGLPITRQTNQNVSTATLPSADDCIAKTEEPFYKTSSFASSSQHINNTEVEDPLALSTSEYIKPENPLALISPNSTIKTEDDSFSHFLYNTDNCVDKIEEPFDTTPPFVSSSQHIFNAEVEDPLALSTSNCFKPVIPLASISLNTTIKTEDDSEDALYLRSLDSTECVSASCSRIRDDLQKQVQQHYVALLEERTLVCKLRLENEALLKKIHFLESLGIQNGLCPKEGKEPVEGE